MYRCDLGKYSVGINRPYVYIPCQEKFINSCAK